VIPAPAVHDRTAGERLRAALSVRRISGIYLWIALIVMYSLLSSNFLTVTTAKTIANEQAVTAIVSIGLTVALAAGVFDLSIAGVIALSNIVVAKLLVAGWPIVGAILATLALMSIVGVVNALLVLKARIDPFIATLGTGSVLSALVLLVSGNQNVLGLPGSFVHLSDISAFGIPAPVIYMLVVALVIWYVLTWTPVGRRIYATGGGRETARLAGVPTNRYIAGAFICSSVVAGIAGVLVVSTIGTGSTEVGPSYLLPAFAAGFLGATQFTPGRFNVWGTVVAVYVLATGVYGLVVLGANVWVTDAFNGVALIVAVGLANLEVRTQRPFRRKRPTDGALQPTEFAEQRDAVG
jgi:ribose transport system permease protein